MPFLDTTDSSFLRSLGTSSAEYPNVSSLLRRGEVLSELAVSEAEKAMSVISGGTPRTDVPPEMQWLVVHATVTSVVALAAKITAHGMTLVVDAVCQDAMGGSYTLKDLPIGMARGPPLWRYILSIAEDSPVRAVLALLWPDMDVGSSKWASGRLAVLAQANAPSGVMKKSSAGACHALQIKHAIQDAWTAPGCFPDKGRDWLSGLKPSEIGLALDDLSGLGVGSPFFARLPTEVRGEVADAFLMKALSMARGPLAAPLEVKPPWVRPVDPSAAPLAVINSSVPAPTKADFERQLGLLPEHSWASAPLMALSVRRVGLEEGHPDQRYLSLPPKPATLVPRAATRGMERYLSSPPVPRPEHPQTVDLTTPPVLPPVSLAEPGEAVPQPRASPAQISLLGDSSPADHLPNDGGRSPSATRIFLDNPRAAGPPDHGAVVAQLNLELATIHQLHTTEQSHVQRLTFEGDRLSSQLRDMAGRLNEMTFTRDDAIARADSLSTALARAEQVAAAQANIATLGRDDVLRAKVRFSQVFRIDAFLRAHGVSEEVDLFCRQALQHRVWGGWALPARTDPVYPVTVTTCLALDAIMGLYPTDVWPFLDRPPPPPVSLAQPMPVTPVRAPVLAQIPQQSPLFAPGRPGENLADTQSGLGRETPLSAPPGDMKAVSDALIKADNDAGRWPPGVSETLAKEIHCIVVTGSNTKSVGFPRTSLYEQWCWTIGEGNTFPITICERVIVAVARAHSAPVVPAAAPSVQTDWGGGARIQEAHTANNLAGAADRQATRASRGGKGAFGGGVADMISILVAWDWKGEGVPGKQPTANELAGCIKRFLGQPSPTELSYIGDDAMCYATGFTIIGMHRSLVVAKLGLEEDPLIPHGKKVTKRSKSLIRLSGWELSFSWGKSQYWDPTGGGYKAKKLGDIAVAPVKPYSAVTSNNNKSQVQTQVPVPQTPPPASPPTKKRPRTPSPTRAQSPRRGDRARSPRSASPKHRRESGAHRDRGYSRSPARIQRRSRSPRDRRDSGRRRDNGRSRSPGHPRVSDQYREDYRPRGHPSPSREHSRSTYGTVNSGHDRPAHTGTQYDHHSRAPTSTGGAGGGHRAYPLSGEEPRRFSGDDPRRQSRHQYPSEDFRDHSGQYSYAQEPARPLAIAAPPVQYSPHHPSPVHPPPPVPYHYQPGSEAGAHSPRPAAWETDDRWAAYPTSTPPPNGQSWWPSAPGTGPQ